MKDDLVEKVARAMLQAQGYNPDIFSDGDGVSWWEYYKPESRAAIRVVVEECARSIMERYWSDPNLSDTDTRDACIAAIRTLAQEDGE